jgi:hypothetical protein
MLRIALQAGVGPSGTVDDYIKWRADVPVRRGTTR